MDFGSLASSMLVMGSDKAYFGVVQLCIRYEKSGFMLKFVKL